jgi:hypothetical protein
MEGNDSDVPILQGGASLTFWNAKDGGLQHTDLSLDAAGETPLTGLLSSDGTGGYRKGQVPSFFGPPDVTYMWMSADGGERVLIVAVDTADIAGAIAQQFSNHLSQSNGHNTTMGDLSDVDFPATIPPGSVPVWNDTEQKWEAATATGLNPNSFVKTAGGSVVRIPDGDTTTVGQEVRAPAGSRVGAANTFQGAWNSGSNAVPVWALGFYLNGYAEGRARATADDRVAFRVERRTAGATGDLFQAVNESGNPLAWINSKGHIRAANLGRSVTFTAVGALSTGVGKFVWFNDTGADLILRSLRFWLDTVGSTPSVFDVNRDGVTLYASGKPTLAASAQTLLVAASFTVAAGQRLSVDVDSAGTGAQNLTAQLELY